VDTHDRDDLLMKIHSFKGMVGSVSAHTLYATVCELEETATSRPLLVEEALLGRITRDIERCLLALQQLNEEFDLGLVPSETSHS
ncbi:MAG: hypothetical protein AAF488_06700, partial [Planctomycetota bacterium]